MRGFFGFILGVIVTIAGAYVYDSQSGRIDHGLAATEGQAPMVNWNVVNDDWTNFQTNVRAKTEDLQRTLKRHIG
ncbi:MAG TPA: hypothetical protein VH206_08190 [Xanthobacteraceae bacterium]|nr:hypothetical protein [Xanthobacteraceae bacterium]